MARTPVSDANQASSFALAVRSLGLTDEQFFRLCRDNEDYRFEMSAEGDLIIMPPASPKTGWRNATITTRLRNWADTDGAGVSFDSSAGFTLPNGAKRSPDGSWILKNRWEGLTETEKDSLTHICPDFVIELRSPSDRLPVLQAKMEEYISNGARLGWLLDPFENQAIIYRPGARPERIDEPGLIRGEPVLPGFTFDFRELL